MPDSPSVDDALHALDDQGGGPAAWETLNRSWRPLHQALMSSPDGSEEQAKAWATTLAKVPEWIAVAIPPLKEIRDAGRRVWPESPDWRNENLWRE